MAVSYTHLDVYKRQPSSAAAGTTYYRVMISAAGSGCGSIVSDTSNAVITPDLLVTAEPTNVNECVGGTDQMSVTVSGGSGDVYKRQRTHHQVHQQEQPTIE